LFDDTLYLPHAVGAIAAYAFRDSKISEYYLLERIIYMRENIDGAITSLKEPYIAAFSNYIWNYEYNKAFAKKIKEKYPECIVIFGGHNIPNDSSLLDEFSFIDVLIHGEGEKPFKAILSEIIGNKKFASVPNISYRKSNGKTVSTDSILFDDIDYPSPYLDGVFDNIMKTSKYKFSAVLETNRGCPYRCAFCDWCLLKSKVRQFPTDRVIKEIEWMAKNKIEFCYCADANYGMFKRDNEIVRRAAEIKKKTGYPQIFRVNFAKNNSKDIFEINKILMESGMSKGVTLSPQSLSPIVLDNIGRKNIKLDYFKELETLYKKAGIHTYSELILGLPGETYESFCDGIGMLLESGQHTALYVYNCELLVNSRLASEDYMKKFNIKTIRSTMSQSHRKTISDDVEEFSNIIVSTSSMNSDMWIKSNLFSIGVQCFHYLGLLQYFAIYLYKETIIGYTDFYKSFLTWLENNPESLCGGIFLKLQDLVERFVRGENSWLYVIDGLDNISWPSEEGAFLETVYNIERFYDESDVFLKTFNIDADIYNDLRSYQKNIIKVIGKNKIKFTLQYDFYNYFSAVFNNSYIELEKRMNTVYINEENIPAKFKDYAKEIVWYGRRNRSTIHSKIDIEY
jgi:putative methyltransferase